MVPLGENYREYHDDPDVTTDGYLLPKRAWGPGPWQDEPDKAQWIDPATGLDCLIVRNHMGSLCGYVGLPPGHIFHEADYEIPGVEVHGGLTFAGFCHEGRDERSICHVPAPGRPDRVWWLGFDCAHAWDLMPAHEATMKVIRSPAQQAQHDRLQQRLEEIDREMRHRQVYRDWAWVASEVTDLARQLAEVK